MTMQTLKVDLGDRGYPIFIGDNLLGQPDFIRPYIKGQQVLVVSNTTVAPLYLDHRRVRGRARPSSQPVPDVFKPIRVRARLLSDPAAFEPSHREAHSASWTPR